MKNRKILHILVLTAILGALAYIIAFFEIPYPLSAYLKIELSDVITLLATNLSWPSLFYVIFFKVGAFMGNGPSGPYYIGEITALVASLSFGVSFKLFKGSLKLRLLISSIIYIILLTAFNYFIATPVYFTQTFNYHNMIDFGIYNSYASYLKFIIVLYVPFNAVKALLLSILYGSIAKVVVPRIEAFKNGR